MQLICRETLPNGLRIVTERMENYRSVSVCCWISAGSIYEDFGNGGAGTEGGISHFIEHMLFKGTEKRSAARIAEDIDAIGGNLNAFTSKECTCVYVKVIDENLDAAVELIADLVCGTRLDEEDIELEKGVVIEEIAMNEDTPEDLVHETLCSLYYGSDPYARPVLGSEESVGAFSRDMLKAYMTRRYRPDRIVVAAAGNLDHGTFRRAVERSFCFRTSGAQDEETAESVPAESASKRSVFVNKDVEQTHIALAFPAFAAEAPEKYPLLVLNNAVGGSVSSRLFQSIREQKGKAYSVYSTPTFFRTSGYFTLYAGTGEKQAEEVLELMLAEYRAVAEKGITAEEIGRSKRQMRTSFLLGRENTSAHASALGRSELDRTPYISDDEVLSRIDAVTEEAVNAILPAVCDFGAMRAAFVGRVGKREKALGKIIDGAV
ncbi:MAG: insulinase family protein [Clostridia bacterium]|nr:insulinase family protein [Clostridia bacterium]